MVGLSLFFYNFHRSDKQTQCTIRQGNSLEVFGPRRDLPKWEWLSSLSQVIILIKPNRSHRSKLFNIQERKWLPAMGYVGEHLTLAGGGDYGDETVSRPIPSNIISFEVLGQISVDNMKATIYFRWRPCMVGTGGEAGASTQNKSFWINFSRQMFSLRSNIKMFSLRSNIKMFSLRSNIKMFSLRSNMNIFSPISLQGEDALQARVCSGGRPAKRIIIAIFYFQQTKNLHLQCESSFQGIIMAFVSSPRWASLKNGSQSAHSKQTQLQWKWRRSQEKMSVFQQ